MHSCTETRYLMVLIAKTKSTALLGTELNVLLEYLDVVWTDLVNWSYIHEAFDNAFKMLA